MRTLTIVAWVIDGLILLYFVQLLAGKSSERSGDHPPAHGAARGGDRGQHGAVSEAYPRGSPGRAGHRGSASRSWRPDVPGRSADRSGGYPDRGPLELSGRNQKARTPSLVRAPGALAGGFHLVMFRSLAGTGCGIVSGKLISRENFAAISTSPPPQSPHSAR